MNKIPKFLDPYCRLGRFDKPIGGWLVFWPCSYASILASYPGNPAVNIFLALSSSFMLRAAGCAANDMWDRNIDKQVERSKTRPIASGELTLLQGGVFCALNLVPIPVIWSLMGPNGLAILYSTIPVIILYPLAKRFVKWPQAVLGVSMNFGFPVNYLYLTDKLDPVIFPMFAGLWCWTMIYDSIYAFQDLKDDKKIGNNSTAVAWNENYKKYCRTLNVGMASCYTVTGYLAGLGLLYYPAMAYAVWKVDRQYRTVDINDPQDCSEKFKSNHNVGMIMFVALLLGKLSKKKDKQETGESKVV